MIRFLFGRPGTGKTTCVIEEIKALAAQEDRPVYLIVPEQQAYSAERDVLAALPASAGKVFSVLSFSRLCDVVADLYGGRAQHTVTRAMKALLMWENLRQLSGVLEVYSSGGSTDAALISKMLAAAEELRVNGIASTSLERAAGRLDATAPLRGKLRDLALVMAAYDGLLSEVYGENPADRMLRAAEKIEKHDFFSGASVYIDSFTSFTMQEYAILRPLLEQANDVTITMGCSGRYESQPQFESMKDTVQRLTRLCDDLGRDYEDIVLNNLHRKASPALIKLEQELWNFELTRDDMMPVTAEETASVCALACADPYEEAEAIALHIAELAQNGVAYEEMAVVVRDTSLWEGILDNALDTYHIPYFLSKNSDLNHKPASRLLLTALRCISRHYQAEDILTLCKTGLLGLSLRDIDYFAEYIDTWHLTGKRMTDAEWSMNPDGYVVEMSLRAADILRSANLVRERVMTPLLNLESKLAGASGVVEECTALYEYLQELGVRDTLSAQAEEYLSLGQSREAGEQVRLWSFLTETLATVAQVMQDAEILSADELCTALTLVFAETNIGSVPARHDCVTVGSASTLRVDRIRAMLVMGLCEGEFPRSVQDDGLLTEQDKETLSELGIELTDRADRLTSDELLYVWRAFSKPTETLVLSYSSASPDGQARSPSAAFSRVKYLFPDLKVETFSSSVLPNKDTPRYRPLVEDSVSRPTARRLLGEQIWLSQSRLQTYAHCPYSYYGSHILRLREKMEAKFDNLSAGNFIHHVMDQYLRLALDDQNRIRPMSPEEVTRTADAVISAYVKELCGDISLNGRLLHLFDRLRQIALMLIRSIQDELRQSAFTVAGLEWDTHGHRPEDPRPMTLTLNMDEQEDCSLLPIRQDTANNAIKLLLGGRIDRVDMYRAEDGETVYIRVVDYKSSKHDFSVKSVTEDMNIQLLLYLFTLCSPENRALFAEETGKLPTKVLPASAVYMSPDESDRMGNLLPCRTGIVLDDAELLEAANSDDTQTYLPSVRRSKDGGFTGKGLCSADYIAELETVLHTAIRDTASAMYAGCANRTPSENACKFCRMKDSCGVCTQ
ncbi:MAG: PD-(D/E)XK nuclease family protein [Clostridia bacterium]|nr:PD-(D/E)XK nuclease family protein [Clostridia bacterium]